MSNNVIIFGSKKFGVSNTPVSTEKYPNTPVLLIEASKQGGKSRRIIFNKKASEVLGLEMGFVQQIVFGFVQGGGVGLIANATDLPSETLEEMQTYRTSKNKVTSENPLMCLEMGNRHAVAGLEILESEGKTWEWLIFLKRVWSIDWQRHRAKFFYLQRPLKR